MTGELMLVSNPKAKKRRRRGKKRRRMSALQRKYFGKRRHKGVRRARRSGGRKAGRRQVTVTELNVNPKKRRGKRRGRRMARHHHRVIRFRRNPIESSLSTMLANGTIGAAGAVALSWIFGNVQLPASLTSAPLAPFVRIGGAVLIGIAADAAFGKQVGEEVGAGAMIVTLAGIFENLLQNNLSQNVQFGRYIPVRRFGRYIRMSGFPRLRSGQFRPRRGIGWMSPARIIPAQRLARYIQH